MSRADEALKPNCFSVGLAHLAWKITRETRRNQKGNARRKAAKARRAAMNRATAQAVMEAQMAA